MQKSWKNIETLAYGYSCESTQWELSNEYQHDRVWLIFRNIGVFVLWTKVASALEGLNLINTVSAIFSMTCRKEADVLFHRDIWRSWRGGREPQKVGRLSTFLPPQWRVLTGGMHRDHSLVLCASFSQGSFEFLPISSDPKMWSASRQLLDFAPLQQS